MLQLLPTCLILFVLCASSLVLSSCASMRERDAQLTEQEQAQRAENLRRAHNQRMQYHRTTMHRHSVFRR